MAGYERDDPPTYDVKISIHDTPWTRCGEAWLNEDGSIYILTHLLEGGAFMLERKEKIDAPRQIESNPD